MVLSLLLTNTEAREQIPLQLRQTASRENVSGTADL